MTDYIAIYLSTFGFVGVLIWSALVFYIKSKWMTTLEDILDDGVRFYSLNFTFCGQGVLQYGTVFLWAFHAKRYGMLAKRNNVPRQIKQLIIFAFIWFFCSIGALGVAYLVT